MFFCTFYNHIYWIRYHGLILESLNIESHLIIRILEPLDSNPPPPPVKCLVFLKVINKIPTMQWLTEEK